MTFNVNYKPSTSDRDQYAYCLWAMTGAATTGGAEVMATPVPAERALRLRARAKLKPVIVAPIVRKKHTVWQAKPPPRLVAPPRSWCSLALVEATSDRAIK